MKSNTKNAKGSGTIRKRSDGRWEARYTTGIDPKTGKQTQKSVYGKTQKEVRQKLTEVTAEIDSGTYLEQTKDTVGEWLDTWLKTYALYSVKSYTYDAYERSCNIHIKPMEQAEITKFLQAIQGTKYGLVYQITLFTGLREGEVLGLTWDCIDFQHNAIYINKQLQKTKKVGGTYCLAPTKNSRNRTILTAPSVMALLRKQKSQQAQMRLLAGEAWNNSWNLVFTNELGGHLCHCTVYKKFKAIVRELGMPEERFHDLRHSFAVTSIESGDDIKTVQSNLGHATASFTLDVYGHVSQKMRQQSADRMEEFIQKVSG